MCEGCEEGEGQDTFVISGLIDQVLNSYGRKPIFFPAMFLACRCASKGFRLITPPLSDGFLVNHTPGRYPGPITTATRTLDIGCWPALS